LCLLMAMPMMPKTINRHNAISKPTSVFRSMSPPLNLVDDISFGELMKQPGGRMYSSDNHPRPEGRASPVITVSH
jgi:hypothetical protein